MKNCRRWRSPGLRVSVLSLLLAVTLSGTGVTGAPPRTLTVFAAASLTDAFTALQPAFERASPGITVRMSYGASSLLRAQIEQGAPADLFASADAAQMQALAEKRLVLAPR